MRILVIVLAFLVAAGLTMLAMGVFEPSPEPPPAPTPTPPSETPGSGTAGPLEVREPTVEPEPEIPPAEKPVRILFLGRWRQSFSAWLTQQWEGARNVTFRAAYQEAEARQAPEQTPGEKPLSLPPTEADLEGVDVVVLHNVDPAALPKPFLEALAGRVRARSTGLLVLPTVTGGAILDVPELKDVLPVAKAAPIAGQPVPGAFDAEVPFVLADAGTKHPATQVVTYPGWNQKIWKSSRTWDPPWGTQFCYPVQEVKPGAQVLLEVEPPRGAARIPALIQGAPDAGRVLWVGFVDFGHKTYFSPTSIRKMSAVASRWILWLAGQIP